MTDESLDDVIAEFDSAQTANALSVARDAIDE